MKLNEQFLAQMREAAQLLQSAGPTAATAAIQRALKGETPAEAGQALDIKPADDASPVASFARQFANWGKAAGAKAGFSSAAQPADDVHFVEHPATVAGAAPGGQFLSASFSNHAGTRAYKLYVPGSHREQGEAVPLVVMLHGCKQHPDDFAAGTGMNRLAEQHGCLVLYPGQAVKANGSNCWNWFQREDQGRDRGEPSLIADLTRQVMRDYRIDPKRVYVAGLSAGGAMAAVMAASYPDLYAAVGIHSGLPVGAAHDVPSAFAAMKQGSARAPARNRQAVPVIVFHGDRDQTVHPANGAAALAQCIGPAPGGGIGSSKKTGKAASGRTYTQTIYQAEDGAGLAEHWVVHGAGHAWSGGSKAGSYTDPKGPDASAEMLRFFYAHPRR